MQLSRCPRRPLLDNPAFFDTVFEVYSWYKKGHLPESGGWEEQSAAFVQLMRAMDLANNDGTKAADKRREQMEANKVKINRAKVR